MQHWLTKSAAALGRGIAAGRVDPVDLARTYLDAIDAHPLTPRIYARVTHDRAMAEARAASERAKAGRRLSPLDGVPISWKDLFDTAGTATEAGSALLKGRIPEVDAPVLRSAAAMGLVCLGKTHMSELAFSGLGYNPVTGTPPCVNDEAAVSGGSSSGAAASVAFGLAAAGIGTDTGGSVRVPAAWNDLVGLKTTSGRLPLEGVVPLCLRYDTIGPLTRSVEDAALLLGALEGTQGPDLRGADLSGRHFAILDTVAMQDVRGAPLEAFESAVDRLRAAGATVGHVDFAPLEDHAELASVSFAGEAYGLWRDVIEAQPDLMFPRILDRFRSGANFTAPDYVAAWAKIDRMRQAWDMAMARYDAVLCPTVPILPPNAERLGSDDDYYVSENLMTLRNTRIANMLGLSSLTLPTGTPSCGLLLMGRPDGEEALLRIGAACETALG
jgi:aspartyl-tRNA(Asn)/glutamyl-tRNA(Gln) amidotransferase subunit A